MGMQADISRWCKECIPCQVSKVTKLREIPMPSRQFTEVKHDIMGPLPRYLLMMIDRNTRWLEVTKLDDISVSAVVSGFLRTWVSRYGVPVTVVTDRGSQFTGELWSTMCKKLHSFHWTRMSYHPEIPGSSRGCTGT